MIKRQETRKSYEKKLKEMGMVSLEKKKPERMEDMKALFKQPESYHTECQDIFCIIPEHRI